MLYSRNMKKILFATGNPRKLKEARAACKDFNIEVGQIELEITEVQSHDPKEISLNKAEEAYRLAGEPVAITDTSWRIPALSGFPGGYMKDVSSWFEPEDFLAIIERHEDKRIFFTETIIYTDENGLHEFSQEYEGKIVEPRGIGESIEQVAEFEGHTLGERREQGGLSHNPEDYIWHQFAKWYSNI